MSEPVVRVRDLRYRYPGAGSDWVLEDVSLDVDSGEYVLVCGPSGSGKSTLCRTFNGLIPHFYGGRMEGRVEVTGLDTRDYPVAELFAHVGLVFQNSQAQLFNSTVESELAFGLESLGLPSREIGQRIGQTAETAGITHLLDRRPYQLSGGEQRLVTIAAALALRPEALVLDEPYASLDPANVNRVRAALGRIHRRGTAIVITEHRLENAAVDAQRMLVLHQGQLALDGAPRDLFARDLTPYGLTLPAVVRAARALGLSDVPLTVESLASAADGRALPPDLLPHRPTGAPAGGETVLRVENVDFSFGNTSVLRDVGLTLDAGECLALVGANGSGKTTLIKHFNGLHRPDRGEVFVLGEDARRASVSELARHVGLVFQNVNNQFFKFQVREEIEVGAQALERYDGAWLEELIELFHLEPLLDRAPYRLSEGEKKRVAFAAALAGSPEILVLDEPTTGQDSPFRQALKHLFGDLRARGLSVVLVTHDLDFAEQCADRWVLLAQGQVLANDHPWEVMSDTAAMRRASLEPTQAFQIRQALRKGAPDDVTA